MPMTPPPTDRGSDPPVWPFDARMPELAWPALVTHLNEEIGDEWWQGLEGFGIVRAIAGRLGLDAEAAVAWLQEQGFECDADLVDGVFKRPG